MSNHYDDKIRKLELEILQLQAENRRLQNALGTAAVTHYVPQHDAILSEVASR